MKFEMPSVDEWNEIESEYPVEELQTSEDDFGFCLNAGSFERFGDSANLGIWVNYLSNRLIRTKWSYVIMIFHFRKGIPDDEWVISPGRRGQSAEYLLHFEKDDRIRKAQFDYFADIFFFKLYSCFDTIGHLLHMVYDLGLTKPDFHRSVKKLADVRPDLFEKLNSVVESDGFRDLKEIRHGVAHRELPGHIGGMVTKVSPSMFTIGTGAYMPSRKVVAIAQQSLRTLVKAMTEIRSQIDLDRSSARLENDNF
ncbi:MAG: Cthe_2314 family HEPN domain-containing protein [Pyrinomonadaceae bacterium]